MGQNDRGRLLNGTSGSFARTALGHGLSPLLGNVPRSVFGFAAGCALVVGLAGSLGACSEDNADSTPAAGGAGGGGEAGAGGEAGGGGEAPDPCVVQGEALQKQLEVTFASEGLPGGAIVGVSTPACGTWFGAVGEARGGVPMQPDDFMRIGSMTKPYVAATMLRLETNGLLSLEDPIEMYVAGIPNGDLITLRMLLNHTSGIADFFDDDDFLILLLDTPNTPRTPQEMVDAGVNLPPYFAPGQGYEYSNTNYMLAGMVIESVVPGPVSATIRNLILGDDFTNTAFAGEERLPGELVKGYSSSIFDYTNSLHPTATWTAGAMVADVADVVSWAEGLYGGDILSPGEKAAMLDTVTVIPGLEYGLGMLLLKDAAHPGDGPALGHNGGLPGYRTEAFYLPESETTVAVLINHIKGEPSTYTEDTLALLFADN